MKIITISREFGSGGRELGKRMADVLGWDYYDREIISAIAEKTDLTEEYVENVLNSQTWQSVPLTFGHSFAAFSNANPQISLLAEQRKVIEEIGRSGRDCIIVGRNADKILADLNPFNIFVCATMDAKAERCRSRAADDEKLSRKELERKIKSIDKKRAATREIISGSVWGQRDNYHLTVNTTGWNIKELAPATAAFAMAWFGGNTGDTEY